MKGNDLILLLLSLPIYTIRILVQQNILLILLKIKKFSNDRCLKQGYRMMYTTIENPKKYFIVHNVGCQVMTITDLIKIKMVLKYFYPF